ncbi:MAG: methyltransferase domain-containing protein [Oscillospiraceae bacterium]|nr:methyltransferase domain-containing protein [Oscillospiraceae bacterium]
MTQEELEKKLQTVLAAKVTFTLTAAPHGKFKFVKRLGRRLTGWYTEPFGTAQNIYNEVTADYLTALHLRISEMQKEIDEFRAEASHKITSFQRVARQEQRQAFAKVSAEQQAHFRRAAEELDRSLCIAAPESRSGVGQPPLTKLPVIGTESLFEAFHAVQNAQNEADTEAALNTLAADYRTALSDSVAQLTAPRNAKPVVLVCNAFGSGAGMEAIRNEVWDLYILLRENSRYPVCILSIEPAGSEASVSGDVYYVADDGLADWMRQNDPALLIFCESTTAILTAGDQCMLLRNSILRLSGQNPAQTLGGSKMQELLHLCDYGVQHYCVASRHAADVMEQHGFRRPAVMYPYIDTRRPLFTRRPRPFDASHLTIGFASSPMQPEQSDSRGIPALCETVRQNPDMQFIVLWRDPEAVPVPDMLQNAENCEIRTGKCDMQQFYNEIDCVLIPYADENYNHACSISAIEGMLLGIPAVATPEAGISELIEACGIGLTASDASADALSAALRSLPDYRQAFAEPWRSRKLRELLSGKEFVQFAEECISESVPSGVHTLYEWDRQLKLENQHLIRGYAALRAYYQRQDVAENYDTARFAEYPQNCFDLMERQSVSVLLEHLLRGRKHTALLDLASGTGRILRELLPFGSCTACDASPAMQDILREKFDADTVNVLTLDLLSDDIPEQYDAVTIFRFLRHYEYSIRKKLWAKLRGALKENSVLLFDVPNVCFEIPHRQKNGWGKYPIYDVFWTRRSIEKELADNGLRLTALVPVGQGLYPMAAEYRDEPMTWTAAAVRIPD